MRELLARQNATAARSALASATGAAGSSPADAPIGREGGAVLRGGAEAMMQWRREEAEAAVVKRTQSLAATMVKNQMADMQAARGRPAAGGRSTGGTGNGGTGAAAAAAPPSSHGPQVNKRGLAKSNSSPGVRGRAGRPLSGLGAGSASSKRDMRANLIPKHGTALFEKRELAQPLSFSFENYHEQFALTRGLGAAAPAQGMLQGARERAPPSGGGGGGSGGGGGGGLFNSRGASLRGPSLGVLQRSAAPAPVQRVEEVMVQLDEPMELETGEHADWLHCSVTALPAPCPPVFP